MTTKVFLVGYMGCGKSTLARKLSRRTGVRAVDTDAEVERVAASGEACIVATGGGLPTWSDNMEMLSKAGTTVYLRRSAERIAARLTPYGRAKRPKLQGLGDAELVEFRRRNIAEREPYYAQAALVLDCDTLSDEEAVERIIHYLEGNE